MRRLFLILAMAALAAPAWGQTGPCNDDKLLNTSGAFLYLASGQVYQIFPGAGRSIASVWMPLDRLMVCRAGGAAVNITNLSRHDQQVKALYMNK